MALVDLIKRMWQPRQLEHPFFGPLRYSAPGCWDGRRHVAPTGATVELTLDASRAGPTELQRQLYHDLEARYSTLLQ